MTTTAFIPHSPAARNVDVSTAQEYVRDGRAFLLDVRDFDEFAAGHAQNAACIPVPDLERRAGDLPTDRPVLVMCQSGGRSAMAAERLRALGMNNITDVQGGYSAWRQAGLPTSQQTGAIPLERQVRIAAGVFVLSFSAAGFLFNRAYFYGAAFIGFMLALTGTLGICPMMSVLKLLPWNRINPSVIIDDDTKSAAETPIERATK